MNEQDLRKLVSELIFALRDLYVDREVMRSILDEGASRTAVLRGWEGAYKQQRLNPPQRAYVPLQPLIDAVTQGLTDEGLQVLLTHVRKLNETLRSYDGK
jgi:hypothetical protein